MVKLMKEIVLKQLKPNPLRNMRVDPIDPEAVERLKHSIEEDGFWGGVVCARWNGDLVIVAGHHRVEAAIAAGVKKARLFIAERADEEFLLRAYARENATQRGTSQGTSQTGAVAAALKVIAKALLDESEEGDKTAAKIFAAVDKRDGNSSFYKWRKALKSEAGLGYSAFLATSLKDVPGIHKVSVEEQLKNLKSSGNYKRIIAEAKRELAEEARLRAEEEAEEEERKQLEAEAEEAEEEAEEAEEEAEEQEITFDLEGVSRVFKEPRFVNAFRECAERNGIPVDTQANLAKKIISLSEKYTDKELTVKFVKDWLGKLYVDPKAVERELRKKAEDEAYRKSPQYQLDKLFRIFTEKVVALNSTGIQINNLLIENKNFKPSVDPDFRLAVKNVVGIVNRLAFEFNIKVDTSPPTKTKLLPPPKKG